MTATELIERVMTEHWNMASCSCESCCEARAIGLRPREGYPTNPARSILAQRPREEVFGLSRIE